MSIYKYIFKVIAIAICTIVLYSCKEKYVPQIKDNGVNYLVVEGLINTGADSTIFTLTRAFKLNNKAVEASEKGAIVQVESETGTTYVLPALAKAGRYGRPSLGLDPTKKHRLRIRTTDKREYLSDLVETKTSQPIDELKYDFKNDQLNVYSNTHDPSGKSRYYLYSYVETYEYRAALNSTLKLENHQLLPRYESIYTCWHYDPSPNIVLGSTAGLIQDELADKLVVSVPRGSLKLRQGYSVLIKQTVLSKEGFDFFESLKKNTQDIGSLFDAQPSQLFGNIRSVTDPSEVVIGFISAGTVTEKRVTLAPPQMPQEWFLAPPPVDSLCLKTTQITGANVEILLTGPNNPKYIPVRSYFVFGNPNIFYEATDVLSCVDCRTQGGVNIKPVFWP